MSRAGLTVAFSIVLALAFSQGRAGAAAARNHGKSDIGALIDKHAATIRRVALENPTLEAKDLMKVFQKHPQLREIQWTPSRMNLLFPSHKGVLPTQGERDMALGKVMLAKWAAAPRAWSAEKKLAAVLREKPDLPLATLVRIAPAIGKVVTARLRSIALEHPLVPYSDLHQLYAVDPLLGQFTWTKDRVLNLQRETEVLPAVQERDAAAAALAHAAWQTAGAGASLDQRLAHLAKQVPGLEVGTLARVAPHEPKLLGAIREAVLAGDSSLPKPVVPERLSLAQARSLRLTQHHLAWALRSPTRRRDERS